MTAAHLASLDTVGRIVGCSRGGSSIDVLNNCDPFLASLCRAPAAVVQIAALQHDASKLMVLEAGRGVLLCGGWHGVLHDQDRLLQNVRSSKDGALLMQGRTAAQTGHVVASRTQECCCQPSCDACLTGHTHSLNLEVGIGFCATAVMADFEQISPALTRCVCVRVCLCVSV